MRTCGIDLGTTNSCIVVVDGDGHRVITSEHGSKIFPSVVYMGRDGKPVVGHAAKSRMGEQPGPVATLNARSACSIPPCSAGTSARRSPCR